MRLTGRLVAPTGEGVPVDVTADAPRLGRDPAGEIPVEAKRYPNVSKLHCRVEEVGGAFRVVHLSRANKTLLNGKIVTSHAALKPGDKLRLGVNGPTLYVLTLESDEPTTERTVQAGAEHLALLRGSATADRFPVGTGGVIGREPGRVQFLLDHPHVSRLHASLSVRKKDVVLADLGTANGTFVNGKRLTRPTRLELGDRVDIGPFTLRFDGTALEGTSRANNVELAADGVTRTVTDRATGKPLTLLDDVSLVVRPREFVCLIGPSGSGKSTLLALLSGRAAPDDGAVSVNGRDLYDNFAALKPDIAVVPQKDLLHDSLSVGAALKYTAELRLPADTGRAGVAEAVADILGVVGLGHRAGAQIRTLSGGQLKRASLANELLNRPSLLFLDEVTSGLDEQTDREVMALFRLLADGGKTVVCVTHTMANVEASCTHVAVLTVGGKLAFYGPPAEALKYFKVDRLGDIYSTLADRNAIVWREQFRKHPLYQQYVAERLPSPETDDGDPDEPDRAPTRPVQQTRVLTRRYLAVWRGDRAALFALLGQSLLVAILLAAVFGKLDGVANPSQRAINTGNLLFLLAVTSFWLGCNTAAKELVKECVIYQRERAVNLRADSYLTSKFIVLTLIALAQVTLLFVVVRVICGPPGNILGQWGSLALLSLAGTSLGLLISAASRTEEVALALVPVCVIPQIVLAGVVAPLSGAMEILAKGVAACYWGVQELDRVRPNGEGEVWLPAAVLAGHVVACGLAALVLLRGRRG